MRHHWLSMHSFLRLVHLAGLATPLASPWDDVRVKHAWKTVPNNWESLGPPHPETTIDLFVALSLAHNENALIDTLYKVSTPGNLKYGAHLSKEEVAELVAPHPETLELVHSWLTHHGVQSSSISTTHGGNWLTLTGVPVSQANGLLGASYKLYQQAGTNDTPILRTVSYALPTVLHAHVKTVAPTTFFASTRTLQKTPRILSVGNAEALAKATPREPVTALSGREAFVPESVMPDTLRWMYNTYAYEPKVPSKNVLGIVGYMDELPSPEDLSRFMSAFRYDALSATFSSDLVDPGDDYNGQPAVEANLEMQYAQAIAFPTQHTYYATRRDRLIWSAEDNMPDEGDAFLVWMRYVFGEPTLPQTIMTSVGVYERNVPPDYADAVCELFAKLGTGGVSVLSSSGDHGVGPETCQDDQFMPKFPATCPYVTSVGGTTNSYPEVAANLSGGGFSNYFARPNYQDVAFIPFFNRIGNQNQGLYNPGGRGIPDISAQALNYMVVFNNKYFLINSTNCATTTVAGIISLVNDFMVSHKRKPLGFLNPWLYGKGASGLNDIKSGSNPGCGTVGFSAGVGWDPVTGLGTPDLPKLLAAAPIYPKVAQSNLRVRKFPELLNISDAAFPTGDATETPRK